MNKTDLIEQVASQADLSTNVAESAVNAVLDTITSSLSKDDSVSITGFGTFAVKHRNERKGRNPRTGEEITIAASNVPSFKAGKALREAVN